jgi:hypothetical protein
VDPVAVPQVVIVHLFSGLDPQELVVERGDEVVF